MRCMLWPIRGCAAARPVRCFPRGPMKLAAVAVACGCGLLSVCAAQAQVLAKSEPARISIGTEPPKDAKPIPFHDSKFGVRFQVPAGWSFNTRDGQVSTF